MTPPEESKYKLTDDARQHLAKYLSKYLTLDKESLELYQESYLSACLGVLIGKWIIPGRKAAIRECLKTENFIIPYWMFR